MNPQYEALVVPLRVVRLTALRGLKVGPRNEWRGMFSDRRRDPCRWARGRLRPPCFTRRYVVLSSLADIASSRPRGQLTREPDELIGAAVYLCLVRDPVQRLISQYEYEVLPFGNTRRCVLQHVASVPA